jgi:hypothetical protein
MWSEGLVPGAANDENAGALNPHCLEGLVELVHGLQREGITSTRPLDHQHRHAIDDLEPEVTQERLLFC